MGQPAPAVASVGRVGRRGRNNGRQNSSRAAVGRGRHLLVSGAGHLHPLAGRGDEALLLTLVLGQADLLRAHIVALLGLRLLLALGVLHDNGRALGLTVSR